VRNMNENQRRNFEVAEPMNRMVEKKTTKFRFRKDKPDARKQIARQAEDVHRYARERSQWESPENVGNTSRSAMQSTRSAGQRQMQSPVEQKKTDLNRQRSSREESTNPYLQNNRKTRNGISGSADETPRYIGERSRSESPETVTRTSSAAVNSYPTEERSEMKVQNGRKGSDMKRDESRRYSNQERVSSGRESNVGRESSLNPQRQKKRSDTSRNDEGQVKPDNVEVRTSPVADKNRGGIFRSRAPSQPKEEKERLNRRR